MIPASNRPPALQRLTSRRNRWGLLAALVLAATVCFMAYLAWPLLGSLRAGGVGNAGADTTSVAKFESTIVTNTDQITGRSFFYDPPRPAPPKVEKKEEPTGPPPPPPPPPKITSYGGPKIIGTIYDTVWFDDNKKMVVGGPLENDTRIISIIEMPYSVKLEWKGVEFIVPFIPRDNVINKSRPATVFIPDPALAPSPKPPEPAKPADTKPGEPKKDDKPKDPAKPADDKKDEKKDPPPPDKIDKPV